MAGGLWNAFGEEDRNFELALRKDVAAISEKEPLWKAKVRLIPFLLSKRLLQRERFSNAILTLTLFCAKSFRRCASGCAREFTDCVLVSLT